LRAAIVLPEEETNAGNEERGEQKFNRQVKCRGERDPDEPASAEIDEGHSRADPGHIMAHVTNVNGQGEVRQLAHDTKGL
jgi:hypothetical protein